MDHHLGYVKHDPCGDGSGNIGNGTRPKTVQTIVVTSPLMFLVTATATLHRCWWRRISVV